MLLQGMADFAPVFVGTGLLAGFIGGLLGVGGGIVIVPVLLEAFMALAVDEKVQMQLAVGTSLATIILTSIASISTHARRGVVDWPVLRLLGPALLAGAMIGSFGGATHPGPMLMWVFGGVTLVMAARFLLIPGGFVFAEWSPGRGGTGLLGLLIGALSAMMGIGGGTLAVPVLSLFRYPIHRAVGTASVIGVIIAVPATLMFVSSGWSQPGRPPWSIGYVSLPAVLLICPASMLAGPVGARMAHRIRPLILQRTFALFLLVVAARMLTVAYRQSAG
jgi:uncharacterized membrane protein YfcA